MQIQNKTNKKRDKYNMIQIQSLQIKVKQIQSDTSTKRYRAKKKRGRMVGEERVGEERGNVGQNKAKHGRDILLLHY